MEAVARAATEAGIPTLALTEAGEKAKVGAAPEAGIPTQRGFPRNLIGLVKVVETHEAINGSRSPSNLLNGGFDPR